MNIFDYLTDNVAYSALDSLSSRSSLQKKERVKGLFSYILEQILSLKVKVYSIPTSFATDRSMGLVPKTNGAAYKSKQFLAADGNWKGIEPPSFACGYCETAGDEKIKVVNGLPSDFVLKSGCIIGVNFHNTNTCNETCSIQIGTSTYQIVRYTSFCFNEHSSRAGGGYGTDTTDYIFGQEGVTNYYQFIGHFGYFDYIGNDQMGRVVTTFSNGLVPKLPDNKNTPRYLTKDGWKDFLPLVIGTWNYSGTNAMRLDFSGLHLDENNSLRDNTTFILYLPRYYGKNVDVGFTANISNGISCPVTIDGVSRSDNWDIPAGYYECIYQDGAFYIDTKSAGNSYRKIDFESVDGTSHSLQYISPDLLHSGDSIRSILQKLSCVFNNIRYFHDVIETSYTPTSGVYKDKVNFRFYKVGRTVYIHIYGYLPYGSDSGSYTTSIGTAYQPLFTFKKREEFATTGSHNGEFWEVSFTAGGALFNFKSKSNISHEIDTVISYIANT